MVINTILQRYLIMVYNHRSNTIIWVCLYTPAAGRRISRFITVCWWYCGISTQSYVHSAYSVYQTVVWLRLLERFSGLAVGVVWQLVSFGMVVYVSFSIVVVRPVSFSMVLLDPARTLMNTNCFMLMMHFFPLWYETIAKPCGWLPYLIKKVGPSWRPWGAIIMILGKMTNHNIWKPPCEKLVKYSLSMYTDSTKTRQV